MSDPNWAHEYQGTNKNRCGRIVSSQHCGKSESDIVHTRWTDIQNREKEEIEMERFYNLGFEIDSQKE